MPTFLTNKSPDINLHILGVQKAGTTALASFLSQHPAIFLLKGKEAHIFDHPLYPVGDAEKFIRQQLNKRLQGYENQRFICDATPVTCFHPAYIQRCYAHNPQAKFVLLLRDPVARAESHYRMSLKNGEEKAVMLNAFIKDAFKRHNPEAVINSQFNHKWRTASYLKRGCYQQQLEQLYRIIPQQQVLVLSHEELKGFHTLALNRVFRFLDVPKHPIKAEEVFASDRNYGHWSDPLAKRFAKGYFMFKGESNWRKLLSA